MRWIHTRSIETEMVNCEANRDSLPSPKPIRKAMSHPATAESVESAVTLRISGTRKMPTSVLQCERLALKTRGPILQISDSLLHCFTVINSTS